MSQSLPRSLFRKPAVPMGSSSSVTPAAWGRGLGSSVICQPAGNLFLICGHHGGLLTTSELTFVDGGLARVSPPCTDISILLIAMESCTSCCDKP